MDKDTTIEAMVIAQHKGLYRVKTSSHEYSAKVTGKHMFEASGREDFPAVGDNVLIEILDNDQAVITKVLPRKTMIKKGRAQASRLSPLMLTRPLLSSRLTVTTI